MNALTSPKAKLSTFSRSALIGISATGADLISLFLMVELLSIQTRWANVPALLIGVAIQFFGNKFYAFENREKAWVQQGLLFSLVEVGALLLNAGLFHFIAVIHGAPYLLARLGVGMLVYLCFSYPLWKLVFKNEGSVHPHG